MEKFMVLCEDGGGNYDCPMFKIYTKGTKKHKGYYNYYQKLNKEDYIKFIEKNEDNDIRLFVDNSLCDDRMNNIDKRARMVKYNDLLM